MDHLLPGVDALVELEHKTIVEKWGEGYHSDHEGYAVMKEEIEEAQDELEIVKAWLDVVWDHIRDNKPVTINHIETCGRIAGRLAAEAVQIAAVARRWRGGLQGE